MNVGSPNSYRGRGHPKEKKVANRELLAVMHVTTNASLVSLFFFACLFVRALFVQMRPGSSTELSLRGTARIHTEKLGTAAVAECGVSARTGGATCIRPAAHLIT